MSAPHWIHIESEIPTLQQAVDFVGRESCGAINTFCGQTRNHEKGRQVTTLHYDCYPEMAESVTEELLQQIRSEFEIESIALFHKIGEVPIGDTSIIIATSAPHRRQAILGTLELLDRFKKEVPIWKKEFFTEGPEWKEEQR